MSFREDDGRKLIEIMVAVKRLGFTELASGHSDGETYSKPTVNILFVHGLRGHPKKTWEANTKSHKPQQLSIDSPTSKAIRFRSIFKSRSPTRSDTPETSIPKTPDKSTCFWPEDLLPLTISSARILTYGYDADIIGNFFAIEGAGMNTISQHGEDLLIKLQRELKDDNPIIFVAHSLGGVVVKDALRRSKYNDKERFTSIYKRTKCIIFLGTPHRGTDMVSLGATVTNIAAISGRDSNRAVLGNMQVGSELFTNIHSDFMKMLHTKDFYVHSFQEGKGPTQFKGMSGKVVDDFSSALDDHPMQVVETINADHTGIAKFAGEDDEGYQQISKALLDYIKLITENLEEAPAHVVEPVELPVDDGMQKLSVAELPAATAYNPTVLLPLARNKNFAGRQSLFVDLEKKLNTRRGRWPAVSIYGAAGSGKSQFALEYAYRAMEKSPQLSVFWVHAGNLASLEKSYQRIADKCEIPKRNDLKGDLAASVKTFLESQFEGSWLMILDEVNEFNTSFQEVGYTNKNLSDYVPRCPQGSVIYITKTMKVAVELAGDAVKLAPMTMLETQPLLVDGTSKERTELLREIHFMPLAIAMANSFMMAERLTITQYLDLRRQIDPQQIQLICGGVEKHGLDLTDLESFIATWLISFEYIREKTPMVVDLLVALSVLDGQSIPDFALPYRSDDLEFQEAVELLEDMSLILKSPSTTIPTCYEIHRMTRLATIAWLITCETDSEEILVYRVFLLLSEKFPTSGVRDLYVSYLPHAEAILAYKFSGPPPDNVLVAKAKLLYKLGDYYSDRELVGQATKKLEEALPLYESQLGEEDSGTLKCMRLLSFCYSESGSLKAAADISWRALAGEEKVLGKMHPTTLSSYNMMGSILQDLDQLSEAADMFKKSWEGKKIVFGEDDPSTLNPANNLALVLEKQGRIGEAMAMHKRNLEIREKTLGKDHVNTLVTLGNLASILKSQGDYKGSEVIQWQVLEGRERTLGKEHPLTLVSADQLGTVLTSQGKHDEAETMYFRALQGRERVLGKNHADTLITVSNMALLFSQQKKPEAAEKMALRAVEGKTQSLGPDHLGTLTSMEILAEIRSSQDRYDEAVELQQKVLKGRVEKLGENNSLTLTSVNNISVLLQRTGKYEEAEVYNIRALQGFEEILGKNHPNVHSVRGNHATLLHKLKRYTEAKEMYVSSIEGLRQGGDQHPVIALLVNSYCEMRQEMGLGLMDDPTIASYIYSRRAALVRTLFECTPLAKNWEIAVWDSPYCVDRNTLQYAVAGLAIRTDIVVLLLPMKYLIRLNVALRDRIQVIALMSLCSAACIASIVRFKYIGVVRNSQDTTWDGFYLSIWSTIEFHLAIIAACVPAIKPLFILWLRRLTNKVKSPRSDMSLSSRNYSNHATRATRPDMSMIATNSSANSDLYATGSV